MFVSTNSILLRGKILFTAQTLLDLKKEISECLRNMVYYITLHFPMQFAHSFGEKEFGKKGIY